MSIHLSRLYLCTDARTEQRDFGDFVEAAFSGGVDIIQLRDKALEAAEELELLALLQAAAERHGKLWSVNDRADIAVLSGSPILHLGQTDLPLQSARTLLDRSGNDAARLGLSSHSPQQAAAAAASPLVDYYCTGPLWATPTKPGRAAVGLGLVRAAAQLDARQRKGGRVPKPWFAIGGIDQRNIGEVVAAGAERVVVVRAITQADDPAEAARRLLGELPATVRR